MNFTLPAATSMGAVTLRAANLDHLVAFYRDGVGLEVISEGTYSVTLGHNSMPALLLEHTPNLKHAGPSSAGLFHSAFLFETQAELAAAVMSVATKYPNSFTGSADHLVSEAFYFDDPEGNGVELYFDRERTSWSWQHGQIAMDTLALDPNVYLSKHLGANPKVVASKIGHVHLTVGSIAQAQDFYVNQLGFETTMNWGGTALFVSAGGYHHHMAMNVWRSRGAGVREQTLGLGDVAIQLPTSDDLGQLLERLAHHRVQVRNEGDLVRLDDPWGNQVTLELAK
jgi:catechol 2,3-dioxygenase